MSEASLYADAVKLFDGWTGDRVEDFRRLLAEQPGATRAFQVRGRCGPIRKQVNPAASAVLLVEDPDFPEQAGDRGNGARDVLGELAILVGRTTKVELDLNVDFG